MNRRTHTPTPNHTDKLLADRLLLHPELTAFTDNLLLVAVDPTTGDRSCEVHLSIAAPGMDPAKLDEIRQTVVDGLRRCLQPIMMGDERVLYDGDGQPDRDYDNPDPDAWAYLVTIEPHHASGEPQVVVDINDAQYLGNGATRVVLDHVRSILTLAAKAKGHYRNLVVLEAHERLVPLDFQLNEPYCSFMTVKLPAGLVLQRFNRQGDDYDENPLRRDCQALEHTLKVVLGLDDKNSQVHVSSLRGAVTVAVSFNTRGGSLKAVDINHLQQEVCDVVAKHVRAEGYYHQLVIRPAHQEHDLEEGDYDEDADFLGRNYQEY